MFIENISFPFPVPLQWAASVVSSLDIQSDTSCGKCSVACLWQMANVINGFITHRRHIPCCWQENVRKKTNPAQNNTHPLWLSQTVTRTDAKKLWTAWHSVAFYKPFTNHLHFWCLLTSNPNQMWASASPGSRQKVTGRPGEAAL